VGLNFSYRLIKKGIGFTLVVNPEFAEFYNINEGLVCQCCKETMKLPIYFCKDSKKLFCRDCVKDKQCCLFERYDLEHCHERILKIVVKGV
jgi:hypothetical protein